MTTIKNIYNLAVKPVQGPATGLTEYSEGRLNSFLDYLSKGQDHPVIQAGIAQIEITNITPFDSGNAKIARLLSYLFLYKSGWDVRGMLNMEEYYKQDIVTYKRLLNYGKAQDNLTIWLEYFCFGLMIQLTKAEEIIKKLKFQENVPAVFWKLNNRQKEVITKLDNPEEKITNKDLQKMYGISQVTASRDLAHLANLGLLLSHGKGRSVFYTKA